MSSQVFFNALNVVRDFIEDIAGDNREKMQPEEIATILPNHNKTDKWSAKLERVVSALWRMDLGDPGHAIDRQVEDPAPAPTPAPEPEPKPRPEPEPGDPVPTKPGGPDGEQIPRNPTDDNQKEGDEYCRTHSSSPACQ